MVRCCGCPIDSDEPVEDAGPTPCTNGAASNTKQIAKANAHQDRAQLTDFIALTAEGSSTEVGELFIAQQPPAAQGSASPPKVGIEATGFTMSSTGSDQLAPANSSSLRSSFSSRPAICRR